MLKIFSIYTTLLLSVFFLLMISAQDDYSHLTGMDDLSSFNDEKMQEVLGLDIRGVKERLEKLFHVIDKNGDNVLDDTELEEWTNFIKNEVFLKQVNVEMKQIDTNKDGFISLSELNEAFSQNLDEKEVEKHSAGLLKRFQIVDKDKDGKLNIEEVAILVNPMKDEELKELEIKEIMEHHDLDKDNRISLKEFKQTRSDDPNGKKDDETLLLEDFNFFDANKDGFIDTEEIIKIYFDPSNDSGTVNIKELRSSVFQNKDITLSLWNEYALKIADTALTDFGDVIRYPENFKLDIGKNVVLPSIKTSTDEEELDVEDIDGELKTDTTGSTAPTDKDVPDEL